MYIGETLRYSRPYSPEIEYIDDFKNYFHETYAEAHNFPLLEKGINPIGQTQGRDGLVRRSAILISSSPHKLGSQETPWQDFFDPDNGYIRYCGDNKSPETDPVKARGNKLLLEEFSKHASPHKEVRALSAPILFFERVRVGARAKGFVKFQGFGIIRKAELVVQFDHKKKRTFSNFVFTFSVFNLKEENEEFEWDWIRKRRDPSLALRQADQYAPASWKLWIRDGEKAINRCERKVSKLLILSKGEQLPVPGSNEDKALRLVYNYFSRKNHKFESLAAEVVSRIINRSGGRYSEGWITPAASDGGADFIGRMDVGTDFSTAKMIVLGQAKCQSPSSPTGGRDIARTVARLKRGWIGVYVTTSYFSPAVQQEVIEDAYPILMINGLRLSQEVVAIVHEQGYSSIEDFLDHIEDVYEKKVARRRPEEILLE